jgi:hypothetical protein
MKENIFAKGKKMARLNRVESRELKRQTKREVAEFLKIQNHYFPYLIGDIKQVMDARHQSYITYEIEVILYLMILKNLCSILSMDEMNEAFNEDECVRNIYKILGLKEKDWLPHYVTINECLSKLDSQELEKIRKKMITALIRKKSFDDAKFLGEHWLVIVDATQLFKFKERHCKHCLTKTYHKGTAEETTIYYHMVLEAKLVLGNGLIVSIGSEFIENPEENPTKQDCELCAFKVLAASLKKMYPRLPICLLADSLYACAPVFDICRGNKWAFLIRFKDGSIPSLKEEYEEIKAMGEDEEETVFVETVYKRKPKVKAAHRMKWVNDLVYKGHPVTLMELEIETDTGKKWQEFQWVSSMRITGQTAAAFANTGRKRWLIENEGFNIQKNHRFFITHANSLNYNAMKNHYLLTQLSDILLQLYENGVKGLKQMKGTLAAISDGLLECLRLQSLTEDDFQFERIQVRKGCM